MAQPPIVMATVVQATPVQSQMRHEGIPMGNCAQQQQPVQATVVQQRPVMGQTVVGHPVIIGSVPLGHSMQGGYGGGYGGGQQMMGDPNYGVVNYGGGGESYPAEDPTILAIFACCCCCWCVGIIAILKAQEVQQANLRGDFQMAHLKRREAMNWIYITVGTGIVFTVGNLLLRMAMSGGESGGEGDSRNGGRNLFSYL